MARQLAKKGEELCPVVWVIKGALAVVQRPLRDHPIFGGRGRPIAPEAKRKSSGGLRHFSREDFAQCCASPTRRNLHTMIP